MTHPVHSSEVVLGVNPHLAIDGTAIVSSDDKPLEIEAGLPAFKRRSLADS
jgi:hypothetical protein